MTWHFLMRAGVVIFSLSLGAGFVAYKVAGRARKSPPVPPFSMTGWEREDTTTMSSSKFAAPMISAPPIDIAAIVRDLLQLQQKSQPEPPPQR